MLQIAAIVRLGHLLQVAAALAYHRMSKGEVCSSGPDLRMSYSYKAICI